jgi:hypothetical protein
MNSMLEKAAAFNQNIGRWEVSRVMDMNKMFFHATSCKQDIAAWDVSKMTNIEHMFYRAATFNQNIVSWDISRVINKKAHMFGERSIQQFDLLPHVWRNSGNYTELFEADDKYGPEV